jgi:hypothetical protein
MHIGKLLEQELRRRKIQQKKTTNTTTTATTISSVCPPASTPKASVAYHLIPTTDTTSESRRHTATTKRLALFQLASTCTSESRLLWVDLYLKAGGEIVFLTLLISWCLTYFYHPEALEDNALRDRLGYNNACVGWDFAPASYVGLIGSCIVTYMIWSYVKYDLRRVRLRLALSNQDNHHVEITSLNLSGSRAVFTVGVDLTYAACSAIFPVSFLVGPTDAQWGWHTALFMQLVVARYLVCLAAYLNAPARTSINTIFIIIYGAISMLLPCIVWYSFTTYDTEHRSGYAPVVWPSVMIALDFGWFACLILTSKMLPVDYPMMSSHVLGEILKEEEVVEEQRRSGEDGEGRVSQEVEQMDEESKLLMLIEEQASIIQTQAERLRVFEDAGDDKTSEAERR